MDSRFAQINPEIKARPIRFSGGRGQTAVQGAQELRAESSSSGAPLLPQSVPQSSTVEENQSQSSISSSGSGNSKAGRKWKGRRVGLDKWNQEKHENLLRVYLMDRKLGNNVTRGYRKRVAEKFREIYPLNQFSEQNLADRLKLLLKGKFLSLEDNNKIHQAVERCLNWEEVLAIGSGLFEPDSIIASAVLVEEPSVEQEVVEETSTAQEQLHESNNFVTTTFIGPFTLEEHKINVQFELAVKKFESVSLENRPRLCKISSTWKTGLALFIVNNRILPRYIDEQISLEKLQLLMYCTAVAVTSYVSKRVFVQDTRKVNNVKPIHIVRLETRINKKMAEYSQISQYIKGVRTNKLSNKVNIILSNYRVHAGHGDVNNNIVQIKDTISQTLSKLGNRLSRYNKSFQRRKCNAIFTKCEKTFYRNLRSDNVVDNVNGKLPSERELTDFWSGIWSNPVQHQAGAEWIRDERESSGNIGTMQFEDVTREEVGRIISKAHNWKAPGRDNITNFWLKNLKTLHGPVAKIFNGFLHNPAMVPSDFATGVTFMLPKDINNTQDPKKYRPITCLNNLYKLFTGIIADRIYRHLDENNVLSEEQKGCRRKAKGCKEQAVIDQVVLGQANGLSRKLYTAFIDYQKAFDSVPHSWLLEILGIYKVHPALVGVIKATMKTWKTQLRLSNGTEEVTTGFISILRGIFQGDSLSPLLFCMAMNPLSRMLSEKDVGYNISRKGETRKLISHLFYMDDIKLYSRDLLGLRSLISLVDSFSVDICMCFGIDKCKIQHLGAKNQMLDYKCLDGQVMETMKEGELYKYLGFVQSRKVEHAIIKEKLSSEYLKRVELIVRTKLCGANSTKAINTYAVPVLTYSFGVIKWSEGELEKLRVGTNKMLVKYRQRHPKSSVERVTLPRSEGGRGILDLKYLHDSQVCNLREYFLRKSVSEGIHKDCTSHDDNYTPLNMNCKKDAPVVNKAAVVAKKVEALTRKPVQGRHEVMLAKKHIDRAASNAWLSKAGLFPETEGTVIAIQEEMIETRNRQKTITDRGNVTNDKCRLCNVAVENIQHILSGCIKLAGNDYTHRHNQVAKIIHQKLAMRSGLLQKSQPYYKYKPATVLESEKCKLYWDRTILTDRTVHFNRPDIVYIDRTEKVGYLIDIAVPNSHNVEKKFTEKVTKYAELGQEMCRSFKLGKVEVIPIIISSTGVIPLSLHKSTKKLGLPKNIYVELQKAVLLNSCRIVRKFMQVEAE